MRLSSPSWFRSFSQSEWTVRFTCHGEAVVIIRHPAGVSCFNMLRSIQKTCRQLAWTLPFHVPSTGVSKASLCTSLRDAKDAALKINPTPNPEGENHEGKTYSNVLAVMD